MHRLLNKCIDHTACMHKLFCVFVVSMYPDQVSSYLYQKKRNEKFHFFIDAYIFVIFGEFILHQGFVLSHGLLEQPKCVLVHIRIKGEVGALKLV